MELGPPDDLHEIVEDQHHGVADQELHQHVGAVDAADQEAFEQHAEQRHRQRSRQHRQRVAVGDAERGIGDIAAQHVEGAMGEVDDLQHAEDQGHARGDQKQQHADDQPAGGLGDHASGRREAGAERVEVHLNLRCTSAASSTPSRSR